MRISWLGSQCCLLYYSFNDSAMARRDLFGSLLSSFLGSSPLQIGVTATSPSSLSEPSPPPSTPAQSIPTASPTTSHPDIASTNTVDVAPPSLTPPQSSTVLRSVLTEISFVSATVTETPFEPIPTTDNPTTPLSPVLSTSIASFLPASSPAPSASESHPGIGVDVGIAIGVSTAAIVLLVGSFWVVKRHRGRTAGADVHPFITGVFICSIPQSFPGTDETAFQT